MPSRFPAIPSVPAHVDPTYRYIFESIRENIEILRGIRGDPRDFAMTASELASIYRRLQSVETYVAESTNRSTRSGVVDGDSRNDRSSMRGFVSSATEVVGSVDAESGADAGAFTTKLVNTGTGSITGAADIGAFVGGGFSGSISGTISKTLANDFPAIFASHITGTVAKTLSADAPALSGTVT